MNRDIEELLRRKENAKLGGGKDKIKRIHDAGRLTARERIEILVDKGSFMEFGMLAHSDQVGSEDKSAGDGIIIGLAKVDGRPVAVQAIDKTVFAGTAGTIHARKIKSIHAYALKRGLPLFHLTEGGGLRMPDGMGSDGISQNLFPEELLLHRRQVPMMTAVLGDSYGDPAWAAVSSDFATQLKGTTMAVAGPRILEMATGENVSEEELGGWKLHAHTTGQADHFSETEEESITALKQFFSYMPLNANESPPTKSSNDDPHRLLENIMEIVPEKRAKVYDMKKVIEAIVDDADFYEMKALYGPALITILARINGRVVGIIANQPKKFAGSAGPHEADKATDFICLCDSYHIPIIFLHDTPGFRVSKDAEKYKMPTKILLWNQALAQSTVPKISIVIRKSIGAAFANMCGPTMGADFVVAWPGAEINFTGPEVGVNVVYGRQLKEAEDSDKERQELLETWEFDSSPYKAAAKHLIEDIIDPRDTRKFLSEVLEYAQVKNDGKSERHLANWPTQF